jgi:hypothetical protein
MTYVINKFNREVLTTVLNGTVNDANTDIRLVGKGVPNFGEIIAENLVWMVENFAADAAPPKPVVGQLWYNTTDKRLMVYKGTTIGWAPIGSVQSSATDPSNPQEGDLWYDVPNKVLKVYTLNLHNSGNPGWDVVGPSRYGAVNPATGSADGDLFWNTQTKQLFAWDDITGNWRLVGPSSPANNGGRGFTGPRTATIHDATPTDYDIIEYVVQDEVIAILSPATFVPAPAYAGFPKLIRGMNYKASNTAITINDGPLTIVSNANSGIEFKATITSPTDVKLSQYGTGISITNPTSGATPSVLVLNYTQTGSPTLDAGLEVERGSLPNAILRWNETSDRWELSSDATNFYEIVTTNTNGGGSSLVNADTLDNQPGSFYAPINSPHFTGTVKLGAFVETTTTASVTGSYIIDLGSSTAFNLTLTGNTTFSFANVPSGGTVSFTAVLKQDATGGRTVTWPGTVKWSSGAAPTMTSTATKTDIYSFTTVDGGSTWFGFASGQNF